MNELLKLAVKAHGGLERWNRVKAVRGRRFDHGSDLVRVLPSSLIAPNPAPSRLREAAEALDAKFPAFAATEA